MNPATPTSGPPPRAGPRARSSATDPAHRRAALTLAFCAVCWSIAGVVTRHLEGAAGFEVTFWRSVFCGITVLAVLTWRTRGAPLTAIRRMGAPGLFSGAMWALMFICFMVALNLTTVANTLLVISVSPLLAALLAWAVLGERPTPATWLAIAAAGIGIWWMVREAVAAEGALGMLVALGVPVAASFNVITMRKHHARIDLVPAVLLGAVLSGLVTAPLAVPFAATTADLWLLALLGVVQLAIPCMLMVGTNRHLAPHEVSLIAMLEVVLGPIWAWLGAGEAVGIATLQGGLVVLAALVFNVFFGGSRRSA
ncbi:MAG: DMT family transporter [Burkholderiaceae bacterium]